MKQVHEGGINQHNKTCGYILQVNSYTPEGKFVPGVVCTEPVGYTYAQDEDGSRVRNYNNLCDKHQAEWDAKPVCPKCGEKPCWCDDDE